MQRLLVCDDIRRFHFDRIEHFFSDTKSSSPSNLWAWLKRHAMANYCPNNLSELHTSARNRLKSAQKRPSIIAACWMQATLW